MFSAQTDRNTAHSFAKTRLNLPLSSQAWLAGHFKPQNVGVTMSDLEGYYENIHEAEATDASDKHPLRDRCCHRVLFLTGSSHEAAHTIIEKLSDSNPRPLFRHLRDHQKGKWTVGLTIDTQFPDFSQSPDRSPNPRFVFVRNVRRIGGSQLGCLTRIELVSFCLAPTPLPQFLVQLLLTQMGPPRSGKRYMRDVPFSPSNEVSSDKF